MEKFVFRLLMAGVAVLVVGWVLNQFGPFLKSFEQVSHVLGK